MRFLGHRQNWERLRGEFAQGRVPNAYLFYGTPGIGKKLFAQTLIQWNFCERKGEWPCGECASCRRVEQSAHPDYYFIQPGQGQMKVEQFRQLTQQLYKAPLEAPLKIVLIDDAQEMTPQAANSLLKTLEEPPNQTLFILIAPNLFRILPTIRSRCRKLFFLPPDPAESAEHLAQALQKPQSDMLGLLEGVEGSLGMAAQLTDDAFIEALGRLKSACSGRSLPFSEISALSEELVDQKVDLSLLLEALKRELFRRMAWQGADLNGGFQALDALKRAQQDIERNVNKTLTLENLLMDLGAVSV